MPSKETFLPNELKQPMIFENALVQHQVRYLGPEGGCSNHHLIELMAEIPGLVKGDSHIKIQLVCHVISLYKTPANLILVIDCLLEYVRMRRVGYAHRQDYESFLGRYKMLSIHTWPSWSGLPVEGVTHLLRDLPVHASEYSFGRTKVFIKSSKTRSLSQFLTYVSSTVTTPVVLNVVSLQKCTEKISAMHEIITKHLLFRKLWVSKNLTTEHKTKGMGGALTFMQPCHDEGNEYFNRIVMGDETWVDNCNKLASSAGDRLL